MPVFEPPILQEAVERAFAFFPPIAPKWMPNEYKEELVQLYQQVKSNSMAEGAVNEYGTCLLQLLIQCPAHMNTSEYHILVLRNHSFHRLLIGSHPSIHGIYLQCLERLRFLMSLQQWGFAAVPMTCLLIRSTVMQTIQEHPAFLQFILETQNLYPSFVRHLYYHQMVFPDIYCLAIFIVLVQDFLNLIHDLVPLGWYDRMNVALLTLPKSEPAVPTEIPAQIPTVAPTPPTPAPADVHVRWADMAEEVPRPLPPANRSWSAVVKNDKVVDSK